MPYNNAFMKHRFDYTKYQDELVALLSTIESWQSSSPKKLARLVKQHTKENGDVFSKDELIAAYRGLAGTHGLQPYSDAFISKIRMKPIRTASGVAPVTVLTKPFPCPGKCIFCPNDIRMPKSYLSDEPGAQRAERNWFDPYLQTYSRLQALDRIGHPIDKVELIILGGTWSFYPESYQIWFISKCFKALNDFGISDDRATVLEHYKQMNQQLANQQSYSMTANPELNKKELMQHAISGEKKTKTYNQTISELYVAPEKLGGFDAYQSATWDELTTQQQKNETASCRSVGLVIETRPDNISEAEVLRIRKLVCTKTQIGVQSLQDEVLAKNNRGHDVAATRKAFGLLRQAGLKIHAHWMANLHGSSVGADIADFKNLFSDPDFHPDELKLYPCSLIESAELMEYYNKGLWKPYTKAELLEVVTKCISNTPEYCRLTRVIRDIPSPDIVAGNKLTNFRQIAEEHMKAHGVRSKDIRAREIRGLQFAAEDLEFETVNYKTSTSQELFLQFVVDEAALADQLETAEPGYKRVVGFLRLSLPKTDSFIAELAGAAMIREIHVYGKMAQIGKKSGGKAQHLGVGTALIEKAVEQATVAGFERLAVISAVGTREYYRKKGFTDGALYQFRALS